MRRTFLAMASALAVLSMLIFGASLREFGASAATATPSNTPTATALAPGRYLAIDCDLATAGVQDNCQFPLDAPSVDAAVVLISVGSSISVVSGFDLQIRDADVSRLVPPAGADFNLNSNPDFNNSLSGSWICIPNDNDNGTGAPTAAVSEIHCSNPGNGSGVPAGPNGIQLVTVHYVVAPGAATGSVPLSLLMADSYDGTFSEIGSCAPVVLVPFDGCLGATITLGPALGSTATPTATMTALPTSTPTSAGIGATPTTTPTAPFYAAIDCDTSSPGLQSLCAYPASVGAIDVAVVYVNNSGIESSISAFTFKVRDPDKSRLDPPPGLDADLNANPDFNNALTGAWACSNPAPDNDTGQDAPLGAASFINCFTQGAGPALPAGGSLRLATAHYNVVASSGTVVLGLTDLQLFDNSFSETGSCAPPVAKSIPCLSATIVLTSPGINKIPEGNAANADLSVPKANLWLCQAPAACSGMGEGELRVVERASNVQSDYDNDGIPDASDPDIAGTGLANTELGLGAYEFSVEYDNFVIQSVNPCDIVFGATGAGSARGPVDELNSSSPANPDCSPDPGPGGNGTCSMSLVLENVVHFGCVTNGQAQGPSGNFDLASLILIPHPDLANDVFPGNNNGVITIIKDNGCELADRLGHPVSGSVNGGLTPVCGDLAVTVRILEGDLNLDCTVDVTDEQLISFRYGSFFGSLDYQKWFDLEPATHDLDIDIKDLQKVFGRDQSTCQVPIPDQPPADPPAPFGN